jgi:hypothetical protein
MAFGEFRQVTLLQKQENECLKKESIKSLQQLNNSRLVEQESQDIQLFGVKKHDLFKGL